MLDLKKIREDFPILAREIQEKDLVYFDNAATTQKPKKVIKSLVQYYQKHNANVHRGVHTLSEEATTAYENAREKVANFIGAKNAFEVIFVRNATEAINLAAKICGQNINENDVITVTALEHHANLVPWQQLAKATGATLEMLELDEDFEPKINHISPQTKVLAITGMSNSLGVKPNLYAAIEKAHSVGAKVVVDAAQLAAHGRIDVTDLECDFLAISAHKMLGPTGIGALYGKKELLEKAEPYQTGGGMIKVVEDDSSTWADLPDRFEAGTPNIADAIAFGEAINYLQNIDWQEAKKHEQKLAQKTLEILKKFPEITIHTPKNEKKISSIISFTMNCAHPHDIASIFNEYGIAIRAGHHCCQPLMRRLKVPATARISFYFYNTEEEVEKIEPAIKKVLEIFS